VLDMNDVNVRDAFINTSRADEARGRRARAVSGRLEQADCAGGGTFRFRSRPCGWSGPTAPAAPSSETWLRLVPPAEPLSFPPIRKRLCSFLSYLVKPSTKPDLPPTSITCERRQSPATTARSQTTCT
jgi:hypothetical protein